MLHPFSLCIYLCHLLKFYLSIFSCLSSKDDGSYWLLTLLLLLPFVTNGLDFPVFGMQSVALEPAQAHFPKLISHVSGSLILYFNKLSSFELHLLIYSVRELLSLCVCGYAPVAWDNDHCLLFESSFIKGKDLASSVLPITPDFILFYFLYPETAFE